MAVAVPPPRTLEETAELVGHHVWIEEQLFEVLGTWVQQVPEAEVKTHLATSSRHHAWHADLLRERLPVRPGAGPAELVRPAPGLEPVVAGLVGAGAPGDTVGRLAGVYRVLLPRWITSLSAHHHTCTAVADAPVARAVGLVLRDEMEEWRAGEALLQSLLVGPDDVDRAVAAQAALERSAVAAAGTDPQTRADA